MAIWREGKQKSWCVCVRVCVCVLDKVQVNNVVQKRLYHQQVWFYEHAFMGMSKYVYFW